MHERRSTPRVKVNLPVVWEGVTMLQEGTVTNLSISGAFVLTGGKVETKELVRLEMTVPDGIAEPLTLWGEVVDAAYEIGFAVRFNPLEDHELERLSAYVNQQIAQFGTI